MSIFRSSDFYKVYFLAYWDNKLAFLNHAHDNLEETYSNFENSLTDPKQHHFTSYLNVEIHTTYFALVETLFTFLYLLNTGNEKKLWCRLAKSNNSIFSNLETLASGFSEKNFDFFEKTKVVEKGEHLLFIDFLFFRGIEIKDEEKRETAHRNIKSFFHEISEDYLNRASHNAIKHSMHAIHNKMSLLFDESIPEMKDDLVYNDALLYFDKSDDERKIRFVAEKIDFSRDLNRAHTAYRLLSNLIKTRQRLFYGLKEFTFFPFLEDNFDQIIDWDDAPKYKSFWAEFDDKDICQ